MLFAKRKTDSMMADSGMEDRFEYRDSDLGAHLEHVPKLDGDDCASSSIDSDYDFSHGIVILHELMSPADLIEPIHLRDHRPQLVCSQMAEDFVDAALCRKIAEKRTEINAVGDEFDWIERIDGKAVSQDSRAADYAVVAEPGHRLP